MDSDEVTSRILLQRLLFDVGLGLETIDNSARSLISAMPEDDPKRREAERIRIAVAALHRQIADGTTRIGSSV